MKPCCTIHNQKKEQDARRGFAVMEVVLAAVVVITFTMGLYFLSEKSFSRLYHFVSTMIGSPYL
ncbi:MAG: hypothetical protein KDB01_01055 [Planctomycetaceae bacterium]|nr:hypothetical protein [Planctomycetaceae bacterium]